MDISISILTGDNNKQINILFIHEQHVPKEFMVTDIIHVV